MADEPLEYVIQTPITVRRVHEIMGILTGGQTVRMRLDRPSSVAEILEDWHQIELGIIAAHERQVRNSTG